MRSIALLLLLSAGFCLDSLLPGLPFMMDCKLHDEVKTVLPKLLSVIEFYHSNKTIRHPPQARTTVYDIPRHWLLTRLTAPDINSFLCRMSQIQSESGWFPIKANSLLYPWDYLARQVGDTAWWVRYGVSSLMTFPTSSPRITFWYYGEARQQGVISRSGPLSFFCVLESKCVVSESCHLAIDDNQEP